MLCLIDIGIHAEHPVLSEAIQESFFLMFFQNLRKLLGPVPFSWRLSGQGALNVEVLAMQVAMSDLSDLRLLHRLWAPNVARFHGTIFYFDSTMARSAVPASTA